MRQRIWLTIGVFVAVLVVAAAAWSLLWKPAPESPRAEISAGRDEAVDEARLRKLCAHCHRFPEPDTLPNAAWRETILEMAGLPGYGANLDLKSRPSPAAIAEWYEHRAPADYTFPEATLRIEPGSFAAEVRRLSAGDDLPQPFVSHVSFVDLFGETGPELLVCEMRHGRILLARPTDGSTTLEMLA